MVALCKFLYAVCIPCNDVYRFGERNQDYHFNILSNVDLRNDYIIGHDKLAFV